MTREINRSRDKLPEISQKHPSTMVVNPAKAQEHRLIKPQKQFDIY